MNSEDAMNGLHRDTPTGLNRETEHANGNWHPSWDSSARLDPVWTEKAIAVSIVPTVSGALDPKTVEFIHIALNLALRYPAGARKHIRRALQSGATREEITTVLQLACLPALQDMQLGAPILLEELERLGNDDR
jgi:alkylhydroperoxidase/carboxymuconolactone decarboxylase family protein YurZ